LKEISDLHYLSPSGCTFWGKKPWSRKKKILWQLGTLIGAPVGIALIAGVAVPAILIGLPIWAGRKVYIHYKSIGRHKRNLIVVGTVLGTVILSPLVASLAVGIGVPILLAYVYGVVPISLCRTSGSCGVTKNNNGGVRFAFDDEQFDNININLNSNSNNYNNIQSNNNNGINSSVPNHQASSSVVSNSVVIPISAIQSRLDQITESSCGFVDSSDGGLSKKNSSITSTCPAATTPVVAASATQSQTPVLVTITMARKANSNSQYSQTELPASKRSSKNVKKKRENKEKSLEKKVLIDDHSEAASNEKNTDRSNKSSNREKSNSISTASIICGSMEPKQKNSTSLAFAKQNSINAGCCKNFVENLFSDHPNCNSLCGPKTNSIEKQRTRSFESESNEKANKFIGNSITVVHKDSKNSPKILNEKIIKQITTKIANPSSSDLSSSFDHAISTYVGATSISYFKTNSNTKNDDTCKNRENTSSTDLNKFSNIQTKSANNYENDCKLVQLSGSVNDYSSYMDTIGSNIKKNSIDGILGVNDTTNQFSLDKLNNNSNNKTNNRSHADNYSLSMLSEKSINPSVSAIAGSFK
jgi:hypothetical protein